MRQQLINRQTLAWVRILVASALLPSSMKCHPSPYQIHSNHCYIKKRL